MDKAAVSRALQHGVGLQVRLEGRYPVDERGGRLPSYTVAAGCYIEGSDDSREAALADLLNFTTPADSRDIEEWLAELSVISASRRTDEFSAELQLTALTSRLRAYPADVAKKAVLGSKWKWFPTWAELETRCEVLAGPRRQMIAALKTKNAPSETVNRAPTAEERARIQDLVNEMFPAVSQEWRDKAVADAMQGDCIKGPAQ